jgi:hypothetical protein
MKKQRTTTFSALTGLLIFLLVSCGNILNPPDGPSFGDNQGRVLLSVGTGVEGARTIFPSDIGFSTYKLTFSGPAAAPAISPITFAPGAGTQSVDLTAGIWTITAEAFTAGSPTTPVASGSVTETVNVNDTINVTIPIHWTGGAGTGTVTYEITDAESLGITGEYMFIPYHDLLGVSSPLVIGSEQTISSSAPSGEYILSIWLRDTNGVQKTVTEVVYVYDGLTTKCELSVAAADFGDFTQISGTATYTENGSQSNFIVIASTDSGYTNTSGAMIANARESSGLYSLSIPRPVTAITVYFFVTKSWNDPVRPAGSTVILANATSENYHFSCTITTVNISGTLTAANFVGGGYATLKAYTDIERQNLAGYSFLSSFANGSNSWDIDLAQPYTGPVYFTLEVFDNGDEVTRYIPSPVMVSNSALTGQDLGTVDKNIRTIYGKATVVVDGTPAESASITVYTDSEFNTQIGTVTVNITDGTWSISVPSSYSAQDVLYCKIEGTTSASGTLSSVGKRTGMYGNGQNSDFLADMGTVNLVPQVTIQGSLTFKVNSSPVDNDTIYVSLYDPDDPNTGSYTSFTTNSSGFGTWNLSIDRPGSTTAYRLEYYSDMGNMKILDSTITVPSSTAPITRPADTVSLIMNPLSGTVRNGSALLSSGELYVAATFEDLEAQSFVGRGSISGGSITGYVLSGVSSGYVAVIDDSDNLYVYITPSTVSLSGTLSLDLAAMTRISTGGGSGGAGTIPASP